MVVTALVERDRDLIAWLNLSAMNRVLPLPSRARPWAPEKRAAVPTPSAKEAEAPPARVLTSPLPRLMALTREPPSVRYSAVGVAARYWGAVKVAAVPTPSALPTAPLPASTPTTAPGSVATRMRWLPVSAMKSTVPVLSGRQW
jgi:hypothetical protein